MKAISASIIVLSGALLLAVGATIEHDETQLVTVAIGGALCVVGLIACSCYSPGATANFPWVLRCQHLMTRFHLPKKPKGRAAKKPPKKTK